MGQDVRNDSRVCRTPPGPRKDLNWHLKPRTIMAVGLSVILTTSMMYYLILPPAPPLAPLPIPPPPSPLQLTPHAAIAIDGDANFSATALLEGWLGDGSSENPYIIDGLEFVTNGGHIISISNTRVSFTISNCDLTGGFNGPRRQGAGIYLENVTNGELVNNIFKDLMNGIALYGSNSNTVFNNTCTSNGWEGIVLDYSDYNTVANNTCNNIGVGISLESSDSNTVANNTCNNIGVGISLESSDSNTVSNNTCNNNRIGIYLDDESDFNTVENNTFSGNTEHDIVGEDGTEEIGTGEDGTEEFDPGVLLLVGFAGIIMLGAAWRMLSGIRKFN